MHIFISTVHGTNLADKFWRKIPFIFQAHRLQMILDCRFPDIPKPTLDRLKNYFEIQRIKQGRHFFKDDIKIDGGLVFWQAYIKICRKKKTTVSWDEICEEVKNTILYKSSFCSLSSVNNSPLLFAHYSDSHRGVSFEFHHTLEFSFAHVEAITYQDRFEKIDIFDDIECCDETLVVAMMFRKSSEWSYENEWRAFRLNKKPSVVTFDPRCLSGVILGCKMTEEDRLEVIKIAKQRVFPITVYEAVMKGDGIGFEIRKVRQAT